MMDKANRADDVVGGDFDPFNRKNTQDRRNTQATE